MDRLIPAIVIAISVLIAGMTFIGDKGIEELHSLNDAIKLEKSHLNKLSLEVGQLRDDVNGLLNNPKAVEKAAREELGVARPNEFIYFFEGKR